MSVKPRLEWSERDGISLLVDPGAGADGTLVAFSDRHGGVSRAPYDSLNLAARVGDDRSRVARNRERVARAAGFDLGVLALARQVHGARVVEVTPGAAGVLGEADGLVTRAPGSVVGIL